jgi:hypothetical protein
MKTITRLFAAALLLVSVSTASAGTIFAHTSGSVNTFNLTFSSSLGPVSFGIFDDSQYDAMSNTLDDSGGFLPLFSPTSPYSEEVTFSASGSDWLLTNASSGATFTLTGSDHFVFGALFASAAAWVADIAIENSPIGSSNFKISFGPSTPATLIAADVAPVPEPSTMLLLLLGVATVLGMAVRREA